MTEIDTAIETYKAQLVAEAELARGDLQEIEDHLRSLTEHLQNEGMSGVVAVRRACERLGDPRAVAREHARVRSPFGARLSTVRMLSAVAMMAPIMFEGIKWVLVRGASPFTPWGMQTIFGTVLMIMLLLRRTWARPVVLGGATFFAIQVIRAQLVMDLQPLWIIPYVGVVLFLMPWRARELGTAGWALALQSFAFAAACYALEFEISTPEGVRSVSHAASVGFIVLTLAVCGTVMRARWAALASAIGAVSVFASLVELASLTPRLGFPTMSFTIILAMVLLGACAAAAATIISWTTSRSLFGSLKNVLR
ncbi:MAG: permease prefix domain 1-containing protein [Kofleriaceae bacterium]